MELWIRSQSKQTLMKVSKIWHEEEAIFACVDTEFSERIGVYSTKERASEVLDEIQCKITQNECLKSMISKLSNVKGEEEKIGKLFKEMIYEMPKE